MQRPPVPSPTAGAILALAVAVRLYGIGWGLPQVYEEARPLKLAWQMGGWGPDESFDPNPHFFNYPSLTLYTQLGAQAALYAGMWSTGAVRSSEDFRVRYHTDPSPFYLLGRLINTVLGAFTVLLVYRVGARASPAGRAPALVASLLLAVNLFHIKRSQMIEVDVPLTFFTVLTVACLLVLMDSPTAKRYALCGAFAGLAAASKYTGALLVVPVVAAHLLAGRPERRAAKRLALALAVFAGTFVLASPFVVADPAAFWSDFAAERSHMRLGHFGVDGQPAWRYYAVALGDRLAGWPALLLAAVGFVYCVIVKRRAWSIVASAFMVPYSLAIGSWAMKADRYALPLLPFVFLFAAAGLQLVVARLADRPGWRAAAAVCVAALLTAPAALSLPRHLERYRVDSRTRCLEWIARNVPAGSFVVSEAYAPPLEGPAEYWKWPGDIRDRIYAARTEGGRPFCSYFEIPMFQVETGQAAAFYDLALYREADVVITTGAVRSRYERSDQRYPEQEAFYDRLQSVYDEVVRIEPGGTGPEIVIYRPEAARPPFSERSVGPPPALRPRAALRPHWHGLYYYRMAVNYEAWNHLRQAVAGYEMALPFTAGDSEVYRKVVYGMIRCLALMGQRERGLTFLDMMRSRAPAPEDARYVERLRGALRDYGR